jgi:hypothetical protein
MFHYEYKNVLGGAPESVWAFLRIQNSVAPTQINPLNAELNPICHFLALLVVHHVFHFSRIRLKAICAVRYTM